MSGNRNAANGAATSFSCGFFGCFGWAAAIGLVIVGLFVMGVIGSLRTDDAISKGTAEGSAYLSHCAAAITAASHQKGWAGLEFSGSSDQIKVVPGSKPVHLLCPAGKNGFPAVVEVAVVCSAGLEEDCSRVVSVERTQ